VAAIRFINSFNELILLLVSALYFYQVGYLVIGIARRFRRRRGGCAAQLRRYAVLVAARNEAGVIGELIASLKRQNYPADLLDIFVVADNCTDDTSGVAQAAGARVYRRFNRVQVGKGYALDYLLKHMAGDGFDGYDAYLIFDADNVVDSNFVAEMNRMFCTGSYDAITSYRNSKNFGQNWITAGYSIWFLREARFVNASRQALGLNCAVSGTGFLISAGVIREKGGWPWHLLTEDIQFSAECAAEGRRIGYCGGAVVYDEQPASFRQSWDQRLRWSKGFYQVDGHYALRLAKGLLQGGRRGASCYDLLMTVAPGVVFTLLSGMVGLVTLLCAMTSSAFVGKWVLLALAHGVWNAAQGFYLGMLLYGLVTVVSEWRSIRAAAWQKLIYLLAFPVFMLTYLPISVAALFQKVEWKPIRHTSLARLDPAI